MGILHSPVEQRYLVGFPAVGVGTKPAVPAADVVAPVIFGALTVTVLLYACVNLPYWSTTNPGTVNDVPILTLVLSVKPYAPEDTPLFVTLIAPWLISIARPAIYVVSGGTLHVPSSLRYFVVPAIVPGDGTSPDLASEPEPTKFVYLVSGVYSTVPCRLNIEQTNLGF